MCCHTNHPLSRLPWALLKEGRLCALGLSTCAGSQEAWHAALAKSCLAKIWGGFLVFLFVFCHQSFASGLLKYHIEIAFVLNAEVLMPP